MQKGMLSVRNPFLNRSEEKNKSEYLTSACSINRVKIAKLPVYGVDDSIEGLTVKEFFSTKLVIEAVRANAADLQIDVEKYSSSSLPLVLEERLKSENKAVAAKARKIIERFGNRLGLLFLTLKLGDVENRAARADWTNEHWDYWAQLSDIILVGGLASGDFGKILKQRVEYVFRLKGVKPYNIILYTNSSDIGILGCATQITEANGVNVVLDFGQTNIKRSYVTKNNNEVVEIKTLEPYPSKYMEWEIDDEGEKLRIAKKLHKYLIKAVVDTYKEAEKSTRCEPNREIVISIASYTIDGRLNADRSGYAKLTVLGDNYAENLWWELSGELRRDMVIKLIHDGTAIALNFSGKKNTVCLSLGSYFGVGFPETKLVWPF